MENEINKNCEKGLDLNLSAVERLEDFEARE